MERKYFKTDDDPCEQVDVYEFFQFYNSYFFEGKLQKCSVRWTKRMTLCAGTCKYEGFSSSTISLSQSLLKYRTANQIKQTLLHQMIHAYLFIVDPQSCRYEGGHGPAFKKIMNNINSITGLQLSIYHNFREEVQMCRTHVWRCNGRCRDQPPFYGYVKRSMNRKPQSADYWFAEHKRTCGGQYIKISQPKKSKQKQQKKGKNKTKKIKTIEQENSRDYKSWGCGKSIQSYMKEMKQQSQKKKQEKNRNSETNSDNTANIFIKKAKTLEQYCLEMKKENKN